MDLLLLGKTPIDPDHPTGSDSRYEPDFEQLQGEIDKLSSPSAATTIDWKKVMALASEVLTKKSKDLLVAGYLAVSLIYTRQIEGFAIGLKVYTDLISCFWDDFFPAKERMRGRLRAIEWWVEKTETALSQLGPIQPAPETRAQLKKDIEMLDTALHKHLEEAPSIHPLLKFITAIPADQSSAEKPKEVRSAKEEREAEISEEISTSKDAQKVLHYGIQKIRQVASYLVKQEPKNPQSCRLTRLAVWGTIEAPPPAENGKTRIPAPPGQIKTILKDLSGKADWENLLKSVESRFPQFIFWLDLNRFVAEALMNLGDHYQAAFDAVCQETAFFVHRLSGLEKLSFSDGTPFADEETQRWLKSIAFRAEGIEEIISTSESTSLGPEGDLMEKEIKKAQALAKKKKYIEAVAILQQNLQNTSSKRGRLLWRLALSRFLINAKRKNVATPYLEQILHDIELYRLEEWDPELALKGFKIVWTGFNFQSDETSRNKAVDALHRIARLDPVAAMRLEKG